MIRAIDTSREITRRRRNTATVLALATSIGSLIDWKGLGNEMANRKVRDWPAIVEKLNVSARGELKIEMGSPGSAQVTRCRLLKEWDNLNACTKGSRLILTLKQPGSLKPS